MKDHKHQFAFYAPFLKNDILVGTSYLLIDKELVHRIIHVLRLTADQTIILFTQAVAYKCTINRCLKTKVDITIQEKHILTPLKPSITLLLPLLKKEALEASLYTATIMGIGNVQLITTEKSLQSKLKEHERERLERIITAAAEQSKQYILPTVHDPVPLEAALTNNATASTKLFADPTGHNVLDQLRTNKLHENILICIGPEGDMTESEKELLTKHGFIFCRLTPSILKSEHALMVVTGIVRALH